jgi:hypothetical protein
MTDSPALSAEYAAATEAHNAAQAAYDAKVKLYRAGKLSDAEYLAARKALEAATAIFDAAFDAEAARQERAEHEEALAKVAAEAAAQPSLFGKE